MTAVIDGKGKGPGLLRAATAAMGTRFEIVVPRDDAETRALVEEALHEIEELHRRLTRFESDSLVSHINRTAAATPVRLDRATFELFRAALDVQQQSHGAFDITVGTGGVVLDASDYSVRLQGEGAALDLGAIAKGFALDQAAEFLRSRGVTSALLHGGTSSVIAVGAPPNAVAWRIALAHSRARRFVDLRDSALSVSRPCAQVENGESHIRDPRTDEAIEQNRCALVIGPSAMMCDAWSTAIAVLGEAPPPPAGYMFHAENLTKA